MGGENNWKYNEDTSYLIVSILKITGIVIGALVGLWLIFAMIISCDLPLENGFVSKKIFEPYQESIVTRSYNHNHTVTTFVPDSKGKIHTQSRSVHDYTEYRKYRIHDNEDYIITITDGKEIEKNYIFFKVKKTRENNYYVSKQTYDSLHIESQFSTKEYKCSFFDDNNTEDLIETWRGF
jgi:hypothetical protein